jgi:hypothetical protein
VVPSLRGICFRRLNAFIFIEGERGLVSDPWEPVMVPEDNRVELITYVNRTKIGHRNRRQECD